MKILESPRYKVVGKLTLFDARDNVQGGNERN